MKTRNEIEEKYRWDLNDYCKDWKEFESRLQIAKSKVDDIVCLEGKLNNPDSLLKCERLCSDLSKELEILSCYAFLRQKENLADAVSEENVNLISKIGSEISTKLSFISSELATLDDDYLQSLAKKPEFANFDLALLDVVRTKPHTLSKDQERILAMTSEFSGSSEEVFEMFDSCDVVFEDVVDGEGNIHKLDNANYSLFLESDDVVLRRGAHKNMQQAYGKFEKTLGTNYICKIKKSCAYSKIRNFNSCLQSAMFWDEIPVSIYKNLTQSLEKNLKVFHNYFKLKGKMLGIERPQIADMYAPIAGKCFDDFSFESAFDLILQALAPLGENYCKILKKSRDERWIDVYPTKNKGTGAFSSGAYGKNPVLLLNFNGSLDSVFTLAHELGHSIHTYLSNKNNCFEKAGYEIFVAEVASTTNEMLLLKYLLGKASGKEQVVFLLDKYLSMFKSTVHRQTMFAEFEDFAHSTYEANLPISCEILSNHYYQQNVKYFGEFVHVPDYVRYEWLRIPHFYNEFYVYKYATGLICADVFSNDILAGNKDRYINFLKSGSTKAPHIILKDAGIDLENQKTFDDAFAFVGKALNDLEEAMCEKQNI